MARKKIPSAPPDPELKAKVEEEIESKAVYVTKAKKVRGMDRAQGIPDRPPGYEGLCGANKANGSICRNKPHFPGTMIGGGRCRFHGGMSTGAITEDGKERAKAAGVTHAAFTRYATWEEYKRSKYSDQERAVMDQIPTTPDLSAEITAQRMKVEHIERERIVAMNKIAAMNGPDANPDPYAHGLTRNTVTGELCHSGVSIQRWNELESMARDTLRKLMHTQKDINPSSRAKGNLRLEVSITGSAADPKNQEGDMPILEEDGVGTVEVSRSLAGSLHDGDDESAAEPRKDDDVMV